jgi:hypothetical protein
MWYESCLRRKRPIKKIHSFIPLVRFQSHVEGASAASDRGDLGVAYDLHYAPDLAGQSRPRGLRFLFNGTEVGRCYFTRVADKDVWHVLSCRVPAGGQWAWLAPAHLLQSQTKKPNVKWFEFKSLGLATLAKLMELTPGPPPSRSINVPPAPFDCTVAWSRNSASLLK